ncbi:hypothetical protein Pla108_12920 [Botrimarina colliarenosi]|uniref:Uncharacterized protein n=1 Tax=Botrimarina colliarenosi TaxID=2528001 RepID=A0A5C6AJY2_9BACT|nr:hypothetical protein [Botrimarina colliarenosi]TWU00343.1 hypothetical protein Pla108_12920 [Botrimarina colliarenosi]
MNHLFGKAAFATLVLLTSGSAEAKWFELVRELPVETPVGPEFGRNVATDGVVVAGAALSSDSAPGSVGGAGYVFDPTSGALLNRLSDSSTSRADAFGLTIAVSGDRALVGAPRGATQFDTAYLFDLTTGALLGKPTGDVRSENSFGSAMAMDNDIALIGSPREFISDTQRGAVYIVNTQDGSRLGKLTSASTPTSWFGSSVDLDGGLALIGSPDFSGVGLASLFDLSLPAKLLDLAPDDTPADNSFGTQVAIDDGVAIVAAPGARSGAAYLFDVSTGEQLTKLTGVGNRIAEHFGASVAIDNGIAVVGAPGVGAIYVFDVKTGTEIDRLTLDPSVLRTNFGDRLAFKDGLLAVSAGPGGGNRTGAVYVYRLVPEPPVVWLAATALAPLASRRRRPAARLLEKVAV